MTSNQTNTSLASGYFGCFHIKTKEQKEQQKLQWEQTKKTLKIIGLWPHFLIIVWNSSRNWKDKRNRLLSDWPGQDGVTFSLLEGNKTEKFQCWTINSDWTGKKKSISSTYPLPKMGSFLSAQKLSSHLARILLSCCNILYYYY